MATPIKYFLAEDTIDNNDIDKLIEWLKTYPRLTKGALTIEFEKKWNGWLGTKYSVMNNSGSSANLLMYAALDIVGGLKNKKVVVPSVGWVTTVAPAMQLGFEPIMCEADPDTFGLDLHHLEKLLIEHNPAIVTLVQVLGVPHKMDEIMALKAKYGFVLLEDACAAMGASYKGRKVGTFGDMASFSMYFGHQISTIEGGIVSTDNKAYTDTLFMLRSHGWGKDLDAATHDALKAKYGIDDFHSPFVFYEAGYNLRSTDLNAFIGIGQIDKMEWLIKRDERKKYFLPKIYQNNSRFYKNNCRREKRLFAVAWQNHRLCRQRNHLLAKQYYLSAPQKFLITDILICMAECILFVGIL